MVSADADRARAGAKHVAQLLRNSLVGIFNRERVDREVAEISDAPLLERIGLQHRIPGADHGGLHANISRPKARARAVGCASIERDTDQRKIQIFGTRNVWQPMNVGTPEKRG